MAKKAKPEELVAFKKELTNSLLLDDSQKAYWISISDKIPYAILRNVYRAVKEKNDLIKKYVVAAMVDKPKKKYLEELESKIKKLRRETLKIEESLQSPDAEDYLITQINKL